MRIMKGAGTCTRGEAPSTRSFAEPDAAEAIVKAGGASFAASVRQYRSDGLGGGMGGDSGCGGCPGGDGGAGGDGGILGSCVLMTGAVLTVNPDTPAAANMAVAALGVAKAVERLAATVAAWELLATGNEALMSTLAAVMVRLLPAGGVAPRPAADDRADKIFVLRVSSKSETSPFVVNATSTLSCGNSSTRHFHQNQSHLSRSKCIAVANHIVA